MRAVIPGHLDPVVAHGDPGRHPPTHDIIVYTVPSPGEGGGVLISLPSPSPGSGCLQRPVISLSLRPAQHTSADRRDIHTHSSTRSSTLCHSTQTLPRKFSTDLVVLDGARQRKSIIIGGAWLPAGAPPGHHRATTGPPLLVNRLTWPGRGVHRPGIPSSYYSGLF